MWSSFDHKTAMKNASSKTRTKRRKHTQSSVFGEGKRNPYSIPLKSHKDWHSVDDLRRGDFGSDT